MAYKHTLHIFKSDSILQEMMVWTHANLAVYKDFEWDYPKLRPYHSSRLWLNHDEDKVAFELKFGKQG